MTKIEILRKFNFYRQATASLRAQIEQVAEVISLDGGKFYLHEGDRCNRIALVGEGNLRVYKTGESGREITLYHIQAGETCILTASCVLAGRRYPATAKVEAPTQAILFPAERFRNWVASHAELRGFVFDTLALRMAGVIALVEEIAFQKMDQRLAEFLLQRFSGGEHATTVLNLTHEQIAAELGSAREVITRLLQELQRTGAIELARGRIKLIDPGTMRAMISRDKPPIV